MLNYCISIKNYWLGMINSTASLGAELDDHLGYDIHQPSIGTNNRHGHSSKTVYTDDGAIEINIPRDRDSTFEPQLVKKQQT